MTTTTEATSLAAQLAVAQAEIDALKAREARFVTELHDRAEKQNLCSEFDAAMEAAGLPGRWIDTETWVKVWATVPVQHRGRYGDDTPEPDRDQVRQAISSRWAGLDLEWEVVPAPDQPETPQAPRRIRRRTV